MKIEYINSPESLAPAPVAARTNERVLAFALAGSALLWVLVWYAETVRSMVAIWNSSETFAHGYLIAPISAWLIWQRRSVAASLEIRPCYSALAALLATGFAWFFAGLAGVQVAQHYAVVLMIPLIVAAVLGIRMTRAFAFPLVFLLFAVPVGESIERTLMEHTADFTVAALRLTGIPVYREGQHFMVPSGSWSVVEACSGLRYLIASVTVGVLYAYLTYRTLWRRVAFVAASIVTPIVANWLRAYMIVMVGHLSGMKYAVGVDHLIYGWLFFGVVMLILFWIGSFWREDVTPDIPRSDPASPVPGPPPSLATIAGAVVTVALVTAVWPTAAQRLEDGRDIRPPLLQAPEASAGWMPVARGVPHLAPHFLGERARVEQIYARDAASAAILISYYRDQRPGARLISSRNSVVPSEGAIWRNTGETGYSIAVGAEEIPIVESRLAGASGNLLVWHWYSIDGRHVVNPYWAKLLQARSVLTGRGDDGAVVFLYAPYEAKADEARRTLREFAGTMLPAVFTSLENARRSKPAQ